jgi:hypothetical protein
MSELIISPDRQIDFLDALLNHLAGPDTKAAFWFYERVSLPVTAEPVDGASPFPTSGAVLAGDGYLVRLVPASAQALLLFFAQDVAALSALVHFEIEVGGELQFRSYDGLSINLPGPMLRAEWQDGLVQRGIITISRIEDS